MSDFKEDLDMLDMEKSLVNFVTRKLTEQGSKNIVINNIKFTENNVAFADVSYTWYLNGWEKRAEHKETVFVYAEGTWHSTLIL